MPARVQNLSSNGSLLGLQLGLVALGTSARQIWGLQRPIRSPWGPATLRAIFETGPRYRKYLFKSLIINIHNALAERKIVRAALRKGYMSSN